MKKAHRGIPGKDSGEGTKKNHFHAEAHITTTFAREAAEKVVGAAPVAAQEQAQKMFLRRVNNKRHWIPARSTRE